MEATVILGIPIDQDTHEDRVSITPVSVPSLGKLGLTVFLERGAGTRAGFSDASYEEQGVTVTDERKKIFAEAQILPSPHAVHPSDLKALHAGQTVVGLLQPFTALDQVKELASQGVTSFALELLPRISKVQPMDALTSMATLAGYRAALLAAHQLNKIFPLMITAAGTLSPARIFVVGAGVAGLQAIATACRLGAVVHAFDVRPAVKEQVETLGATFVNLPLEAGEAESSGGYAKDLGEDFYRRQQEMMETMLAESDAVITTAAVPGKRAPILITKDMIARMRRGSIIIDLAAEAGGNCELTKPGETISVNGVSIVGTTNLPSTLAYHASQMFANNIVAFLENLIKEGKLRLDLDDQIIRETLLTHQGDVISQNVRQMLS